MDKLGANRFELVTVIEHGPFRPRWSRPFDAEGLQRQEEHVEKGRLRVNLLDTYSGKKIVDGATGNVHVPVASRRCGTVKISI